ncbi:MAG: thiamine pyrophosphate-dependent enzyme [Chloroflexales bacterium]|nr:thiamine pyrophosphate-dependent enzyme [Chloroflexales bacterium]
MHGGDLIASVLAAQGVQFLFTLCGGHISPILAGCKQRGIRVIDTRHEVTAVFAADAVARLTGRPGVAAVTAGPGLTNTITAVKNAQIAQSPLVLLGGAAATMLKGRGALQDIDQMALLKPHVKWAQAVRRVADLVPAVEQAFREAQRGVPGPVFVECPVDLLYDEQLIRQWYGVGSKGRSLSDQAMKLYFQWHTHRLFTGAGQAPISGRIETLAPEPDIAKTVQVVEQLQKAERPLLLIGSQALLDAPMATAVANAVAHLGIPVYLSGMARGLLGKDHPLQMRHRRREALKEADMVILAGVPCDFRLDYGRHIRRSAFYVSANRSKADMMLNRRPNVGVLGDAGRFLRHLAALLPPMTRWAAWQAQLRQRDQARNAEIARQIHERTDKISPVHLCSEIESSLGPNALLVGDGGDFVATASYIVQPRGPLAWLDPGAFGTLGVGAGFALGAKLCRPDAEVWALFGDGALGYSLVEFDTFARHQIPVIAVVGNDAGWTQIAREQVEILKDDVGTVLDYTAYHRAAAELGAAGFALEDPELVPDVLQKARYAAADGRPVLVNAILGKTDFRKGSLSM